MKSGKEMLMDERLFACCGCAWKKDVSLADYSTFRIGGIADFAAFPATREQLAALVTALKRAEEPFLTVGRGSNLVFPDEGLRGTLIVTSHLDSVTVAGNCILADAGVSLTRLSKIAAEHGLSGGEFLYGIPGSVGGAIYMNAGAFGGETADVCAFSDFFDCNSLQSGRLNGASQGFANRHSVYREQPEKIILGGGFSFSPGDPERILAAMQSDLEKRKSTQPLEYPSAGSVFRRPVGNFAGKLIEECGLKGLTVGGAQVSTKHAGFIVNLGNATASDVKKLTEQVAETVLKKTNIALEPEIRFL